MSRPMTNPTPGPIEAWEISPHLDTQYDFCIIPVSRDPEGREALKYAKDVLEMLWDNGPLNELDIKVTLRRTTINEGDIDDGQ